MKKLGTVKTTQTLYFAYDDDFWTEDCPKDIYTYYRNKIDYEFLRKGSKLNIYYYWEYMNEEEANKTKLICVTKDGAYFVFNCRYDIERCVWFEDTKWF